MRKRVVFLFLVQHGEAEPEEMTTVKGRETYARSPAIGTRTGIVSR